MVVLATVATVIASQAVISGAFSVTRQAVAARLPAAPDDPPHLARRSARSTCRPSTGASSSRSSRSSSASAPPSTSPPPTASRSPARWRSTRCCSSSSSASLWRKPLRLAVTGAIAFLIVDLDVLRRQPAEDRPRRLVPARDRRRRVHRADHLAARARDRHREARPSSRARCATSSRRSATATRRSSALPRTGDLPRRQPGDARRSRCAPTSSTTTSLHESVVIVVGR